MRKREVRKRNNSTRQKIKRQKYNIFIFGILAILLILVLSVIIGLIKDRDLNEHNKEVIVFKTEDRDISSFTLKEIRKRKEVIKKIKINGVEDVSIRGCSLNDLLNDLDIDTTKYVNLDIVDPDGNKKTIAMENALDPGRFFIVYNINGKLNKNYDDSFGLFAILDTRKKTLKSWYKDVDYINIY